MHGFISLKFHSSENDGIIFHMTTTHAAHYLHSTKHEYNIWYVFQVIHLCHNMGISIRFEKYFICNTKKNMKLDWKSVMSYCQMNITKVYIFSHSIND
jgi:hypothetical protein